MRAAHDRELRGPELNLLAQGVGSRGEEGARHGRTDVNHLRVVDDVGVRDRSARRHRVVLGREVRGLSSR